jgi:predicted neutral ceramidase superfamily lipid hydrolase
MTTIGQFSAHTTASDRQDAFLMFFVSWAALAISSFLFFHFNRNAALKRRVFPWFGIIVGIILGCFVAWIFPDRLQFLFIAVPMIIFISFLNIHRTRFCDGRGRTLYQQPVFSPSQCCPRCGAALK